MFNVFIKYIVDKTQLDSAEKSAKRVDEANEKLADSANKAGKSLSDGFKPVPKEINNADKEAKNLNSSLVSLISTLKLLIRASVVKQIVEISHSWNKQVGIMKDVESAYKQAIPSAELTLERLRRSTKGVIADTQLMQTTLRAKNFGISMEALPKLLEVAARRAKETGVEVDYLVNSIVDGIGRKSIRVLDNLQVSASDLKAELKGVSIQAASTEQISVAMASLLEKQMQGAVESTSRATRATNEYTRAFSNLQTTLQTSVTPALVEFQTQMIKGVDIILRAFKQGVSTKEIIQMDAANDLAFQRVEAFIKINNELDKESKILAINNKLLELNTRVEEKLQGSFNIEGRKKALMAENVELARGLNLWQRFVVGNEEVEEKIKSNNQQIEDLGFTVTYLNRAIELLSGELKSLSIELDNPIVDKGLLERLAEQAEDLGNAMNKAKTPEKINKIALELETINKLITELKKPVDELDFAWSKVLEKMGNGIKGTRELPSAPTTDDAVAIVTERGLGDQGKVNDRTGHISDLKRAFLEAEDELKVAAIDNTSYILNSIVDMETESYRIRLEKSKAYYDQQYLLAGTNDRAKRELAIKEAKEQDKLRRQLAEKERKARMYSIVIDTAASIAKTAATVGYPAAIPLIAIAAATGLTQLAIASQAPKFKDGVIGLKGKGTGTSDSIHAMLSKGESVMTADETKSSKGIFTAIRANKLNDKIMDELRLSASGVQFVGSDNSKVVDAINGLKNSMPDVEHRSGLVYKTKVKSDKYKMWVRSSSLSR